MTKFSRIAAAALISLTISACSDNDAPDADKKAADDSKENASGDEKKAAETPAE